MQHNLLQWHLEETRWRKNFLFYKIFHQSSQFFKQCSKAEGYKNMLPLEPQRQHVEKQKTSHPNSVDEVHKAPAMAYREAEVCAVYPDLCWCHTWCFSSHPWMSLYSLWEYESITNFLALKLQRPGFIRWSTASLNSYCHISSQLCWQIRFSATLNVLLCKDQFLNHIKPIIHFSRYFF